MANLMEVRTMTNVSALIVHDSFMSYNKSISNVYVYFRQQKNTGLESLVHYKKRFKSSQQYYHKT